MIKEAINKLMDGLDLTIIETREVFEEILSGIANENLACAFLTALERKKPTNDEITQAILSSKEEIKAPSIARNNEVSIEHIQLKETNEYLNIALMQDLICSANDIPISKYYKDNSFEILKELDIDIKKEIDYSDIQYEKLNFSYINPNYNHKYFKYSENLRKTLPFDNILNITSKLLNPLNSKNIYLGVNSKDEVEKFANIALKLNYSNSVIVCGQNSLPFVSTQGESYVAEAWKNKIFTYILNPELLGFKSSSLENIKIENTKHNANCILEIISNKRKDAMYDAVILNSALSLYITKKAPSIMDGINLAKNTIESGRAFEKLEQLRKFYN